jgi:hypothetical protein
MSYSGEERRAPDPVQQQIEALIMAAQDPKDKAFLLIMNKIAVSLDTNTSLTHGLSTDMKELARTFKIHEEQEMAYINQGRGGIRAAIAFLSVIQIIVGFVFVNSMSDFKNIRQELTTLQREVAVEKAKNFIR